MPIRRCRILAALAAFAFSLAAAIPAAAQGVPVEQATMLSAFGERAAFSPDGTRVAFVGKSYGDAYEVELATGRMRNLTANAPHQGVLRVQYLDNGDYLILAPKRNIGPGSRLNVDLYVLARDLKSGLQPLDQGVFEGVAVGRSGAIAWQQIPAGEKLRAGETWMQALGRITMEHYSGRIAMQDGKFRIVDRKRIMSPVPEGCGYTEVQDFRDSDREVLLYCGSSALPARMGIFGYKLATGSYVTYKPLAADYAEIEGVAPDGRWTTVECGQRKGSEPVPPLDICRLELVPGGRMTKLVIGTQPGTTKKVSNSVVSPDGKSIAFQVADGAVGDFGEGGGIYLMRIAK